MNNVTKLPATQASDWIDEKLQADRGVDWSRKYHAKHVLMIEEQRNRAKHYTVIDGEVCMSLQMGIDLEIEQAMRALINRIDELESNPSQTEK